MAFVTRLRPRNPIKPGGYIYVAIMFALHPAAEIPVKTNVFPSPNAISLFRFLFIFLQCSGDREHAYTSI
jgi:hypothetical protein